MPLVLAAVGPGGFRLTAVDAAARRLGLHPGEPLGRVRGRIGVPLHVHPADPQADADALLRLGLWAQRYTPLVARFGAGEACEGLHLDIAGASHLHGGETGLLADLAARLARNGVPARLAVADTPGAAFALARFGPGEPIAVPPGGEAAALRDLPVEALRCGPEIAVPLKRLGLRRIGQLAEAPRAPLARRFGEPLLLRLDQALGHRPDPLVPIREAARYGAARGFLEPIGRQETIVAAARRLMGEIAPRLEADGLGARAVRLTLERVDGLMRALDLGLSEPTRCPDHLGRLLQLRLERLGADLDAGFGFESLRLDVTLTGPIAPRQSAIGPVEAAGDRTAFLADALRQRFGRPLIRLQPRASHLPERADRLAPWRMRGAGSDWPAGAEALPPRPLVLFERAESAEDVLATVPEGPPRRFRWRRRLHRIAHAEGPERIACEWWREAGEPRDYYRVECEAGRRLWLFRDGPHASGRPAAWFVQGVFA